MSKENDSTSGYVYILSNKSMPGIVKIGCSTRSGRDRACELFTTGVPEPFNLEFEIFTHYCMDVESEIHEELHKFRRNQSREFFELEIPEAVRAVTHAVISQFNSCAVDIEMHIDDVDISYAAHRMCENGAHVLPVEICCAFPYLSDDAWLYAVWQYKKICESRKKELSNG